ncbi:hypothetical protein ACJMK2_019728 [Sinanodonta woodiana]|uniref:Uncharacterized protein n=1 Tax=Sinanodonta woodiana TaxID=1069815 RepID=A0ABD3TZ22_SINWO
MCVCVCVSLLNWQNELSTKMVKQILWNLLGRHNWTEFTSMSWGVGCTRNFADKWIEHQDDFNTLLASLNQDHSQGNKTCDDKMDSSTTQVSSLEAKSKLSRSRVHYQKFTKGKDLSSKSLNDLACVFGQRKSKSEVNSDAEDNGKDSEGLFTMKSEDSVQEYFAKKMAALQRNKVDQDTTGSPKSGDIEDKSESDQLSDKKKSKSKRKSVTFSIGDEEINTREETRIKENAETVSQDNGKDSEGLFTVKSEDSVQEYFAKKMAALQRSKFDKDTTGSPKSVDIEDKSESDQLSDKKKSKSKRKSVTFSIGDEKINTEEETRIKENAVTVSISNEETSLSTKSRSKKSKKRKYLEKMEKLEVNVKDVSLSIECNSVSKPKKSKRKDKFHQEGSSKGEMVNESDNSLNRGHETLKFEDDSLKNDSENNVSNHFSAKSRHTKSKKRKRSKETAGSLQEEMHTDEDPLPSAEAEPVLELKKSKKKKCKSENIEIGMKEESKVDTMEGNKEVEEKEIIKSKSSKKSKKKKETHVEHKEVDVKNDTEDEKDCKKRSLIEECKDDRNERAVNDKKQNDEGSSSKTEKTATVHLPTGISSKRLNFPYVNEVKKAFTGSNIDHILGYVDYQFRHESMNVIRK